MRKRATEDEQTNSRLNKWCAGWIPSGVWQDVCKCDIIIHFQCQREENIALTSHPRWTRWTSWSSDKQNIHIATAQKSHTSEQTLDPAKTQHAVFNLIINYYIVCTKSKPVATTWLQYVSRFCFPENVLETLMTRIQVKHTVSVILICSMFQPREQEQQIPFKWVITSSHSTTEGQWDYGNQFMYIIISNSGKRICDFMKSKTQWFPEQWKIDIDVTTTVFSTGTSTVFCHLQQEEAQKPGQTPWTLFFFFKQQS